MRLSVDLQRQIIQYHSSNPEFSNRKIAKLLGISHNTVAKVLELLRACKKEVSELNKLNDYQFSICLGSHYKKPHHKKKIEPDWDYIHNELKKRDITLNLLWQEYRIDYSEGLSYSQFAKKYRNWKKKNRLAMKQTYKCGEQILVDFCGRTMPVTNPNNGKVRAVQVFVGVLGASGKIFAIAVESQKIKDWLTCHIEMFRYFEGVPQIVVTDNLKSAVIKNTRKTLEINKSYSQLAEHYDFAILPTRPRKPRDKGLAETCVQIVQRGILAKLRNRTFFSIEELNSAIYEEIEIINHNTTKRFKISRQEQYLVIDKPFLKPLPKQCFEVKTWIYARRVNEFYRVQVDGVSYSVPYTYTNKHVDIALNKKVIEIYHQRERIATHLIAVNPEQLDVLNESHMPEEHRKQKTNNKDFYLNWAIKIGNDFHLWVEEFLSDNSKYALNLRKIHDFKEWISDKQYESRLNLAGTFAIQIGCYSITNIKNIVKSESYKLFGNKSPKTNDSNHENIRGSTYYKNLVTNCSKGGVIC